MSDIPVVVASDKLKSELKKKVEQIKQNEQERLPRLLKYMESLGLRRRGLIKEIAEKTGYTVSSVSNMLSGKVKLSDKFIKLLCSNFKMSESYVMYGVDYPVFQTENPTIVGSVGVRNDDLHSFEEGVKELQKMTGAKLRRAVAMLMEMNEEK